MGRRGHGQSAGEGVETGPGLFRERPQGLPGEMCGGAGKVAAPGGKALQRFLRKRHEDPLGVLQLPQRASELQLKTSGHAGGMPGLRRGPRIVPPVGTQSQQGVLGARAAGVSGLEAGKKKHAINNKKGQVHNVPEPVKQK